MNPRASTRWYDSPSHRDTLPDVTTNATASRLRSRLRPLLRAAAAAGAGYALGTIPSADMAARLATRGRTDLRATGSGNPGAANAMAVLGSGWGLGVLAADIAKGAAAGAAGRRLAASTGAHVASTAAVVGHCFPVWSGFRGGKGVATSVGQCLVTFPAYVPIDLTVAAATATRRFRRRSYAATAAASGTWVVSSLVWWRRGWPNLWGPAPTVALPLAALTSSAVILSRFAAAERARRALPTPGPTRDRDETGLLAATPPR